ncbi:MAG: hypothetical protein QXT02_00915 [Candidatus Hadarchaeum sp.]|uniref:hypothetical protein n=1 Tax=Candidatus Hadarchaeum sp. TaxID=2883567 RepID=UPI003180FE06
MELLHDTDGAKIEERLTKKRFACAHCGNTWIEPVGFVIASVSGKEDLFLRIGTDSDICGSCALQFRECRRCGSREVYEIMFQGENPLEFDIKHISST